LSVEDSRLSVCSLLSHAIRTTPKHGLFELQFIFSVISLLFSGCSYPCVSYVRFVYLCFKKCQVCSCVYHSCDTKKR